MAAAAAFDLRTNGGRIGTQWGEALVCAQCALSSDPVHFTYLHGYYVRGSKEEVKTLLRAIGATLSGANNILCPYCYSYGDFGVHEGFFRLWRSVRLEPAQLAQAWATRRAGCPPAARSSQQPRRRSATGRACR